MTGLIATTGCAKHAPSAAEPSSPVTVTQTADATSSPSPTPKSEPSTGSSGVKSQSSPAPVSRREALQVLKKQAPRFREVTDAQIEGYAGVICKSLKKPGFSVIRVDRSNLDAGMTSIESVSIIAYSSYALCPEFNDDVATWVDSL